MSLLTTDLPVSVETSPGDDAATTAAAIPGVFAGQLEKEHDRDTFEFAATKGTAIQFRGISRSVGSAAVLMLRLQGAAGNPLAESPIGESDEPVLNFTFPEDGTYRLTVEDLAHRGGADFTYAIVARTGPQFSLALKTDPNNRLRHSLPAGTGALHLDVTCQRYAYDGPITLAIESPRHGWQLFNNVIPGKANEVRLYVVAPVDLAPGELTELRIVGRADDSGGNFIAPVSTLPQLRAARPFQPYPPAWQEGLILAMGAPVTPPFYTLSADRQEVNLARQVGETKLTLTFERTDPNFKDVPLTVLPLGLPAGIAAEVKRNNPGPKETYDVVLKGPKDMAEGVHSFRYFAFSEMGTSGRSVQSGDVRLNVVTPLSPGPGTSRAAGSRRHAEGQTDGDSPRRRSAARRCHVQGSAARRDRSREDDAGRRSERSGSRTNRGSRCCGDELCRTRRSRRQQVRGRRHCGGEPRRCTRGKSALSRDRYACLMILTHGPWELVMSLKLTGFVFLAVVAAWMSLPAGILVAADTAGLEPIAIGQPTRIEVFPTEAKLVGPRSHLHLVVTGHYADGSVQDFTRAAEFTTSDPAIVEVEGGIARPRQDGSAQITVAAGGQQAIASLSVSNFGQPQPISFEWETLAALSKQSCNSGACHGSPSGKGGFRLSLRAFDKVLDSLTLIREDLGRRTNPVSPDESLLLAKPLMKVPHGGGLKLKKSDAAYSRAAAVDRRRVPQ